MRMDLKAIPRLEMHQETSGRRAREGEGGKEESVYMGRYVSPFSQISRCQPSGIAAIPHNARASAIYSAQQTGHAFLNWGMRPYKNAPPIIQRDL